MARSTSVQLLEPSRIPGNFWGRLWLRLAVQGALLVGSIFVVYEIVEHTLLVGASPTVIHALHLARGMGAAFLLGTWSFVHIRRARVERDRRMQQDMELLEAQVRHQERMASLGVLAAGFAHDLGNPLASLATELELLEGEEDIARFRESLGVVQRHVGRMSRSLREIVDFARRRREEVSNVSIASAARDSARLVCHDPRWKRVKLVVDVPSDLPPVRMVEDHLVLVLVNLMINAADAMPNGGALTVVARHVGKRIELRVHDTGVGMTSDVLARAATPFFTTKPRGRGTGLGLAVSYSVVRSVGGDMKIASTPGVGTEVAVTLPAGGGADA